jgi:hypothetical protein
MDSCRVAMLDYSNAKLCLLSSTKIHGWISSVAGWKRTGNCSLCIGKECHSLSQPLELDYCLLNYTFLMLGRSCLKPCLQLDYQRQHILCRVEALCTFPNFTAAVPLIVEIRHCLSYVREDIWSEPVNTSPVWRYKRRRVKSVPFWYVA